MMRTPVVVIGAGQAGLAMSRHLTARAIDHVVLERGEVANSWRTERWDSLRLLTPNWMSRLPGHHYSGPDPDGFMTKDETVGFIEGFGRSFDAPVRSHVRVERVSARSPGFDVVTDRGTWSCDVVVAATGASSEPKLPPVAAEIPSRVRQLTALRYKNPGQIGQGEVLVVGASASGTQIADELRRNGRSVTIAVGDHVRLPRMYRGRDIYWWLDTVGRLDERYDEIDDLNRARRLPSLQLVGTPEHRSLDLNSLAASGVRTVGKLMRIAGAKAQFSGALANLVANADLKQNRLLNLIDEFVLERGLGAGISEPTRPAPTILGEIPTEIDIARFETIIWATGHRPSFSWLDPSLLDHRGRISHDGGVCATPGLYLLGLPFLRRRKSSLIDGADGDAADLVGHLHAHLDQRCRV